MEPFRQKGSSMARWSDFIFKSVLAISDSEAPDCHSKVRITYSPRFMTWSSIKCVVITSGLCCSVVSNLNASTFGRPNKVILLSPRNTQRLPDTAASTLLRLLKPHLLSLREHLGCIMQIFPHCDVDMWGCVWMSRFRGAWISLKFS